MVGRLHLQLRAVLRLLHRRLEPRLHRRERRLVIILHRLHQLVRRLDLTRGRALHPLGEALLVRARPLRLARAQLRVVELPRLLLKPHLQPVLLRLQLRHLALIAFRQHRELRLARDLHLVQHLTHLALILGLELRLPLLVLGLQPPLLALVLDLEARALVLDDLALLALLLGLKLADLRALHAQLLLQPMRVLLRALVLFLPDAPGIKQLVELVVELADLLLLLLEHLGLSAPLVAHERIRPEGRVEELAPHRERRHGAREHIGWQRLALRRSDIVLDRIGARLPRRVRAVHRRQSIGRHRMDVVHHIVCRAARAERTVPTAFSDMRNTPPPLVTDIWRAHHMPSTLYLCSLVKLHCTATLGTGAVAGATPRSARRAFATRCNITQQRRPIGRSRAD